MAVAVAVEAVATVFRLVPSTLIGADAASAAAPLLKGDVMTGKMEADDDADSGDGAADEMDDSEGSGAVDASCACCLCSCRWASS